MFSKLILLLACFVCSVTLANVGVGEITTQGYVGAGSVVYVPNYEPGWSAEPNSLPFQVSNDGRVTVAFNGINLAPSVSFCASQNGYPSPAEVENCPFGAGGKLVNSSATKDDIVLSRKGFSAFAEQNKAGARFVGSTRFAAVSDADADVTSVTLSLNPAGVYYFTFVNDDDENDAPIDISIKQYAAGCAAPAMYSEASSACATPTAHVVDVTASTISVDSKKDTWTFYAITPTVVERIHYINFTAKGASSLSDVSVVMRVNGLPSNQQNTPVNPMREDDTIMWTFNGATYVPQKAVPDVYYLGVHNAGADVNINITMTGYNCAAGTTGVNCEVKTADTMDITNTTQIYGNLPSSSDMVYYQLKLNETDLPSTARAVRVSVANRNQNKDAPALYARLGYDNYPTHNLHDFNSSVVSGVSQLVITIARNPLNQMENHQYTIGVTGKSGEFKIWAVQNCPGNCDGVGFCTCMGTNCTTDLLYLMPNSTVDSFGSCECSSSKYKGSYDCTDDDIGSSSGLSTMWIVLISIGAFIGLLLLIGVPTAILVVVFRNRKRATYEQV